MKNDELKNSDLLKVLYNNYEVYTNTVSALRFISTNLYDGQLRDFPSSDVGLKNAYSSSLNWLYWWREGAEVATHKGTSAGDVGLSSLSKGFIVILI